MCEDLPYVDFEKIKEAKPNGILVIPTIQI